MPIEVQLGDQVDSPVGKIQIAVQWQKCWSSVTIFNKKKNIITVCHDYSFYIEYLYYQFHERSYVQNPSIAMYPPTSPHIKIWYIFAINKLGGAAVFFISLTFFT